MGIPSCNSIEIVAQFRREIRSVPKDIAEFICDEVPYLRFVVSPIPENLLPFVRNLSSFPGKSKDGIGDSVNVSGTGSWVDGGGVCVGLVLVECVNGGASLVCGGGEITGECVAEIGDDFFIVGGLVFEVRIDVVIGEVVKEFAILGTVGVAE